MENYEVDAKIAQEVMGWRLVQTGCVTHADSWYKWVDENYQRRYDRNEWQPSTNIAHAFEVLNFLFMEFTVVRFF